MGAWASRGVLSATSCPLLRSEPCPRRAGPRLPQPRAAEAPPLGPARWRRRAITAEREPAASGGRGPRLGPRPPASRAALPSAPRPPDLPVRRAGATRVVSSFLSYK